MKLFLNQDFVNKEQFWPESAITDGRPDSEVGNGTSYFILRYNNGSNSGIFYQMDENT